MLPHSALDQKEQTMLQHVFLKHPQSVDETYLEHAIFAGGFALRLFAAAGAALIHAVIPALFEKTASRIIAELYDQTHNRGNP